MVESERNLGELAEGLSRVLARLSLVHRRSDTGRLATGNLTWAQISILFVLLREGPIRMAELAAHEGVRNPTVTVAIRRLEKLGLVQRSRDPSDLRAVVVQLTPQGLAVLRESLINRRAALVAILGQLSDSDLETLTMALAALERLADQAASSLGLEHDRAFTKSRVSGRPPPTITGCDHGHL
jgi:DNA-binding MarR family transcriptional regulator